MTPELEVRGFRYALEPLKTQCAWQRDRLQQDIAKLDRELQAVAERLRAIEQSKGQIADASAHGSGGGVAIDPRRHANTLAYLEGLWQQHQRLQAQQQAQQQQRTEMEHRLRDVLARHEAYVEHRGQSVREFRQETERLDAVEADRAWLSRQAVQEG